MNDYESRFLFHGEAVAFGARLQQPSLLDVQAAVALPSVGGRAIASACGYVLGDLVRFDVAGSEVWGQELPDGTRTTTATAWVTGLRVGDVLRADRLAATLESRHERPTAATPLFEPGVEPSFPRLTLTVDGLDVMLNSCKEDPAAVAFVQQKATFADVMATPLAIPPGVEDLVYHGNPGPLTQAAGASVLTESPAGNLSLFLLRPPDPLVQAVPSVGGFTLTSAETELRFYLGEYVIARGRRRFSLLRIEMRAASAAQSSAGFRGSMSVVELSINGVSHP